jgi:CRISPR-associated protein Cas2
MTRAGDWLVTYDITCPRRLVRVHRFLARLGLHAQLSVFVVHADRAGLAALLAGVAERIHPKRDDVRAYRLGPGAVRALGAVVLPRGILASAGGRALATGSPERARLPA